MLTNINRSALDELVSDERNARNLSLALQKEELSRLYPNAIFSKPNQSLGSYIDELLSLYFCGLSDMNKKSSNYDGRDYLKGGIQLLNKEENIYLVRPTKEIYPKVAKKFKVREITVERSIRYLFEKFSKNESEAMKKEILAAPIEKSFSNFYFLTNMVKYIRMHYYKNKTEFTEEERNYLLSIIPSEFNMINLYNEYEKRKKIQYFLYKNLGFFHSQTTVTQQLIIDCISYFSQNDDKIQGNKSMHEILRHKWKLDGNTKGFNDKLLGMRFTIQKSWEHRDEEMARMIFGEIDKTPTTKKYIKGVSNYIKAHNIV